MDAAAERLRKEIASRNRVHLNEVAEAVFVSHAGYPVEVILAELMRKATTAIYAPTIEVLQSVADAISAGRRFYFV